jgi:hypothetical protein
LIERAEKVKRRDIDYDFTVPQQSKNIHTNKASFLENSAGQARDLGFLTNKREPGSSRLDLSRPSPPAQRVVRKRAVIFGGESEKRRVGPEEEGRTIGV